MAENDTQNVFSRLLGIGKPVTEQNTIANIIGGALFGAGFIGALGTKQKTYQQVTSGVTSQIAGISAASEERAAAADKALTADLAGYQAAEIGKAEKGLEARGITDKAVATETAANLKAGMSGAYAAAHAALAKAKAQAAIQVGGAQSAYYQNLAAKQAESVMRNYYSRMGIWGALGGATVGIVGAALENGPDKVAKPTGKSTTMTSASPRLNLDVAPKKLDISQLGSNYNG